ncbi:glycosyltransferase family 52 [Pasteurellaceae bacterium 22721_9_1]
MVIKNNFIFIVSGFRNLLLILLLLPKDSIENGLFVADFNLKSLKWLNYRKKTVFVKKPKSIIESIFMTIYLNIYSFFILNRGSRVNRVVYGSDHIIGAKYFLRRFPFILIEDGTANYDPKSYQRSWKNKLFSIPTFGVYKNVTKIYLTQKKNIPDIIKNKVDFVDVRELWNKKTSEEKDYILSFFNIDDMKLSILKQKKHILFTQPLSEDGVLTEEEKVDLYSKIVKKYDKTSLVIKPHPREKTNYSILFPQTYIFEDALPAELLELLGVDFERVITLFSTAVLQYPKEKIDFYGTNCHSKLIERFGIVDIFDVNCNL